MPDLAHHDHGHSGHDHYGHGPGAAHAPADFGAAFLVGFALNAAFVAAEAVFGLRAGSTALLADAGHNLGDVLALGAAWGAARLARAAPSERFTYGLGACTIWAALANAVLLLGVTGAVAAEAVRRLLAPAPAAGGVVMALAAAGVVVNGVTAALFARGRRGDVNLRAAFQHMLGDALVSAGVVVAGGLILVTHAGWIDPATSLVVSGLIVWGAWGLLRESAGLALAGVPAGVDVAAVRGFLEALPGVEAAADLHVWAVSTTRTALTCRLVMPAGPPGDAFLQDAARALERRFAIAHATLQVETQGPHACPLATARAA